VFVFDCRWRIQALRTIVRRNSHFWARFCIIRKEKT
jgi:hypothetical protein